MPHIQVYLDPSPKIICLYIQNGSAKFAGENNMKNTAGLPNGWGAQPQRVCSVSQSSNTKKGDRSRSEERRVGKECKA